MTFKSLNDLELFKKNPTKDINCKIEDKTCIFSTHAEIKGIIIAMFVIDFIDSPLVSTGEIEVSGLLNRVSNWLKVYYNDYIKL